jgi:hypothetical protein
MTSFCLPKRLQVRRANRRPARKAETLCILAPGVDGRALFADDGGLTGRRRPPADPIRRWPGRDRNDDMGVDKCSRALGACCCAGGCWSGEISRRRFGSGRVKLVIERLAGLPGPVRACHEADPTGFGSYRAAAAAAAGVRCDVIAPSKTPSGRAVTVTRTTQRAPSNCCAG